MNNLIAAIVSRTRDHPDIVRGASVRGAIAFKEVLQGFMEIQGGVTRSSIEKAALITLPPRIYTKEGSYESAVAIVNDIVKEVLYGIRFSKEKTETVLSYEIDLLSSKDTMTALQNLNLDPTWLSQEQEQPLDEKGQIVVIPDQDVLQEHLAPKGFLQDKKEKRYSPLDSQVSGKELADTIVEFMDARDKQWEEEKELSFVDMYVCYRMSETSEGDYVSTPKRDWYGFTLLIDYLEQRGLLGTTMAGKSVTLTGLALNTLLEHLMTKAWGQSELKGMVDYGKAWLTERKHDVRRYTIGDVFRDISIRHTLKEIARRKKRLSDIQRRDLKVFIRQRHKSQSDIVLCVDSSGSMGSGQKLIYARLVAAELAKAAVENGDRVGVVTFDDFGRSVLPLTSRREEILDYIVRIDSGGSTNIGDGIECATELLLSNHDRNQKHIVLVTDGEPTAISEKAFSKLDLRKERNLTEEYSILETRKASSSGIMVSVIYVADGKEAGGDLVKNIAKAGKGQVRTISTVKDIKLMTK